MVLSSVRIACPLLHLGSFYHFPLRHLSVCLHDLHSFSSPSTSPLIRQFLIPPPPPTFPLSLSPLIIPYLFLATPSHLFLAKSDSSTSLAVYCIFPS